MRCVVETVVSMLPHHSSSVSSWYDVNPPTYANVLNIKYQHQNTCFTPLRKVLACQLARSTLPLINFIICVPLAYYRSSLVATDVLSAAAAAADDSEALTEPLLSADGSERLPG